jgi:multidrug efflux pump subunit AcrA (membrane-fusion protein)
MEIAHNTDRKKRIVKKAAAIFFIIVILLTFFSKTIDNLLMPEVDYATVSKESLDKELDTIGEIKLLDIERVSAWRDMKISEVRIKEGNMVPKGTVLAMADKADAFISLKSLEVEVLKAQNEYESLKSQYKIVYNSQEEAIKWLEKDLEEARKKYDEAKMLYENGLEDYKGVKSCQTEIDGIKDKIEALKQKEDNNKKVEEDYRRNLSEKEADLRLKKIQLDNLKKNLDDGEIKSPIDGVVNEVSVERGSMYGRGQLLFEIAGKDSGYRIEWKLNTARAEILKEGDTVDLTITGERKISFESNIKQKKYIPGEGLYLFTSEMNMKDAKLKVGQVEINIIKKSTEYQMVVPNSCIFPAEGGKNSIFVLKQKDGVLGEEYFVKRVEVKVLDSNDSNSAISGNLAGNDNIVSFSSKVLADGVRVKTR